MSDTPQPLNSPPGPDPLLGQVLGGAYEIQRLLGSGGMGNVYEARHVRLPKRFAVKVVRGELARDEAAFERFKREAEIASSLGNKHIVEVFDFNVLPDGSPYMVMELLAGEDLATRLGRTGRLTPEEANAILGQVVSALEAAHARGIVHRDIKPENIFLTAAEDEPEFVKLLDFGLSKIRGAQKRLTANLSVLGTPWYMSPEQARGDADLDHRTDLYALAVVLFQVLAGRVPFDGENVYGVLTQIATQAPPPLSQFAPGLPAELERVLARAMAKEPGARFASVREFWDAVQVALGVPISRRSMPTARVAGPDGQPFRVPTPAELKAAVAPTVNTSLDKVARISAPTAVYGGRPSQPDASASMIAVHQAAFPKRSGGLGLKLGIGAGVLAALALGGWLLLRPAPKPVVAVEPAPKVEAPAVPAPVAHDEVQLNVDAKPIPAIAPAIAPSPKPAAAKVDPPPKPKPAAPVRAKKPRGKAKPGAVLNDEL